MSDVRILSSASGRLLQAGTFISGDGFVRCTALEASAPTSDS